MTANILSLTGHGPVLRSEAERWGRRLLVFSGAAWVAGVFAGFETALAVQTAAGFAGLAAGIRIPALGVLATGLVCTIDPLTRHMLMDGGLLRWNTLNYVLIAVAAFYWRDIVHADDRRVRLLQLFVAALIVQLAYSPEAYLGVQHVLGILALFGLWVYHRRGAGDGEVYYWMGLLGGLQGLLGGLLFNLQRDQLPPMNYNAWGLFPLTAMFTAALGLPFAPHRRGTLALALLAGASLSWVFLSSSRGDLLIGVATLVFVVTLIPRGSTRLAALVLVLVLGFGASSLFSTLQENTWRRLTKLFDSEQTIESRTSGRSDLIKGGWYIFTQHPLGVGTGGFNSAWASLGYVEGISGFRYGEEFPAHAGWIKVLAENGIPGTVLFVVFVFSFAAAARRCPPGAARHIGYMTTVVLTVAFWSTEFQGKGFWLLAAAGMTLLGQALPDAVESRRARVTVRRLWTEGQTT